MASGDEWNAEKMFELYLHDYMVKKKMYKAAEIFKKEAKVCNDPVAIDSPDGFLSEWWSFFYDVYASRQLKQHEPTQMMDTEPQNVCPLVPKFETIQQTPGQFPTGSDFDKMFGQPAACSLATKIYEEEHFRRPARHFVPDLRLPDVNKLDLSKSEATSSSHIQQQRFKQSQQRVMRENRQGISLGRTTPMDPTLFGVPKTVLPRTGPRDAGLNEGVNPMPLKGWPLTGVDRIPPGLGHQLLNSFLQVPNHQQQSQMSTAQHQQELFAQVLSHTPGKLLSSFPGSSANLNTQNLMFPGDDLNGKDQQSIVQMKQATEHQQQPDQLQQEQLQEVGWGIDLIKPFTLLETLTGALPTWWKNDRKRKISSHSQAGDNTSDYRDAEEDKPVDENVDSFLLHDDNADNTSTSFSNLKQQSTACNKNEHKGFTFEEVGCLHSSKSKVLCCHFSSEGKLLASAGHDKKVLIWNTETFDLVCTSEGHSHIISDVRFRPNSTIFATSSFDRTVQIWDAARPSKSLFKLLGHAEQVMSLDFHPRKVDLLCSCDSNDEIRLWNVNQSACIRVSKGATRQVRFQPRAGNLLATAAGNSISITDVETDSLQFYLEGHVKEVRSICWDTSGKYIASVSEDSARIWSTLTSGKCVHELHSNGNNFQSCTFHPGYSQLLVIGGYQSLELWNPTESSKTMTVPAHDGFIAALADSPQTEVVASVSHDQCVKLWK